MKIVVSVGGKFHSQELAAQLDKRGFLTRLITTRREVAKAFPRKAICIPVPEYIGKLWSLTPGVRSVISSSLVKDNLFDLWSIAYLVPSDIFIVYAHYGLFSLRKAKKLGAKIVIERASTHILMQKEILEEEYKIFKYRSKPIDSYVISKQLKEYEEADYITVPSEFAKDSFISRGVNASKVLMLPFGVDPSKFWPLNHRDRKSIYSGKLRVLFVGGIDLRKGVQYLLESIKQIGPSKVDLLLLGTINPDISSLLKKYTNTFRHIPHVPFDKLRDLYREAHLFVLPSLEEGSALVTYQAMACGLAIVTTPNAGAVARDGIDGFIIPSRNVELLREKILYFDKHRDACLMMGNAASEHVRLNYTWDSYGKRIATIYSKIAGAS